MRRQRRPDPADRRRIAVRPSPRILAAAGKIYGPLAAEGGPLLGRYSRPELELLVEVLQRIQTLQQSHTERIRGMRREGEVRGKVRGER